MAERQTGTDAGSWVPAGLKVRGGAPVAETPASKTPANDTATSAGPSVSPALSFPPLPANDPVAYIVDPALEPAPHLSPNPNQMPHGRNPGFEPLPILTLVTAICLVILIWLGSWQWEKFVQKSTAPKNIATIEAAPVPVALEASTPEYRPVVVEGLMDSRTIKINAVQDSVRGYRLFSPVVMDVGSVFVDRGFVSEADVSRIAPVVGQVRLNGVLRAGAKANAYTPGNEAVRDVWYWPDIKAMSDTLMIQPISDHYYVAITQVDPMATGSVTPNPYADSKGANQIPPERHLGYALTWWGFGLALLGVYIGMHVRAGRLRFKRTFS
jgi:surfeit locus 1 family protein